MGGFSLTKPGLLYGDGSGQYYPSTQDALNVVLPLLQAAANSTGVTNQPPAYQITPPPSDPNSSVGVMQGNQNPEDPNGVRMPDPRSQAEIAASATAPDATPPAMAIAGGGPEFSTSSAPLPKFFKPTFAQANAQTPTDIYGRPSGMAPGLTKLGVLANFVHGMMQGGSDALASGALNAAPGKSGFGSGFEGATMMPIQRAMMARQTAVLQNEMALKAAQTNEANAGAVSKGTVILPRPGAQAINLHTGATTTAPMPERFENLQQALTARTLAVQAAGGDPMTDPQASQLRDQITSIQRASNPTQPKNEQPFDLWVKQNPDKPVSEYFKLQPAARAEFHMNQPNDLTFFMSTHPGASWNDWKQAQQDMKSGLTAAQRGAIETKHSTDLQKLQQNYTRDPKSGMYEAKDGTLKSPEEFQQMQDAIDDARFDRYMAAGEVPPDLTNSSGVPGLLPAHGNTQSNPYYTTPNPYRH